jgi:AbrB family looped-hinge helix DNA binding protein
MHTMSSTMKGSIDAAGRLVIPKAIRQAAGLGPETPLEIRYRDGRVEIEPAPVEMRIEMRGKVAVAVPTEPVPPLTTEEVERLREELRGGRERRWGPE